MTQLNYLKPIMMLHNWLYAQNYSRTPLSQHEVPWDEGHRLQCQKVWALDWRRIWSRSCAKEPIWIHANWKIPPNGPEKKKINCSCLQRNFTKGTFYFLHKLLKKIFTPLLHDPNGNTASLINYLRTSLLVTWFASMIIPNKTVVGSKPRSSLN